MSLLPEKYKTLAIIGPSGVGKSTIIRKVVDRLDLNVIRTGTERPKRVSEDNFEHEFLNKAEFDNAIANHKFVEVIQAFNLPYRYGFPVMPKNNHRKLIMIRSAYVNMLRQHYMDLVVYQIEGPKSKAIEVISSRDKGMNIGTRISGFDNEVEEGREVSDRVFVHDFNNTEKIVEQIIEAINQDLD